MERGNLDFDEKGNLQGVRSSKKKSTEAKSRDGLIHSSEETLVMGVERRDEIVLLRLMNQPEMGGIHESGKAV